MVTRIRSLNTLQYGLVLGLIYGIFGLLAGIFWIPFAAMMATMPMSRIGMMPGAGIGIFAIILFPILYFIGGFIFGIILAALYNLIARWTGGIEMTLDASSGALTPTGL